MGELELLVEKMSIKFNYRILYALYETCISGRKGKGTFEEPVKGQKRKSKTACDK